MICKSCKLNRNPASDTNKENGWIGCALRLSIGYVKDQENSIQCEVQGEGWIDRSYITDAKSGHHINLQLLHQNVTKCPFFQPK